MPPILADVKCSVSFVGDPDRPAYLGDPFTLRSAIELPEHLRPDHDLGPLQVHAFVVVCPLQRPYLACSYFTSGCDVNPVVHLSGIASHEPPGTSITPLAHVTGTLAARNYGLALAIRFPPKVMPSIWKTYGHPEEDGKWLASRLAPGRWGGALRLLSRYRHILYVGLFTGSP